MEKILVIDDDLELCDLLQDYLGGEGFSVDVVHRGDEGAQQVLKEAYSLVVLDVMLPGMNGFDVLRKIRETNRTPVIMLTARGDDVDRIVGLELGADDYLPKPFNPRELIARIRAVQRRTDSTDTAAVEKKKVSSEISVGDISLCRTDRSVTKDDRLIELTSVEFNLLDVLLELAGQVVSRELLVEKVLGRELSAYDRSIDVHISALRKKLGHYHGNIERIRTIRGVGYLYTLPGETDRG